MYDFNFNRRGLIRIFSLKKQAEIQEIPYFTRIVNCRNLSFLSSGFWGGRGTLDENLALEYEHTIFIPQKNDHAAALGFIGGLF